MRFGVVFLENRILIDYLSFTSPVHSFDSVIKLLGLDSVDGVNWVACRGARGYTDCMRFMGINIFLGNKNFEGVWVEMSGGGCRTFDTFSAFDWSVIFFELHIQEEYHITRLDVAYDDWNGLLDIDKISKEVEKQNYISNFRYWETVRSSKGSSVYLGSPASDVRFRIYDKAAETGRTDEIPHWVRFEIQLRNDTAYSLLKKLDTENIGSLFCGVLKNYIRFVKPSVTESNKSRWNVRKWWLDFVGDVAAVPLWTPSDTEYNLYRCKRYVYRQAGNAITSLIEIMGIEQFYDELKREKAPTSAKYKELVRNSKLVEDCSGDDILDYLAERGAL